MQNLKCYIENSKKINEWIFEYLQNIESYPVKSKSKPGEILEKIPETAPDQPESFDNIFEDFKNIIIPGITHWQSPNFFAYFPANNSLPSILAENLTAALGAQCMVWDTSPAAAELEQKMMKWLANALDLPEYWEGVIQDTASTATLTAILTAREYKSDYSINSQGFTHNKFRVYASKEAHSSVDKAVKIAGIGKENLVKIETDDNFAMDTKDLKNKILKDLDSGFIPLCVVGAFGTTGSTAIDPLDKIGAIAKEFGLWFHVDAAFAGTALILPEKRSLAKGVELADSFVFNPHKWMLVNFDCSAYFVKNKEYLIRTFEYTPEYLKTKNDNIVNNYRDWGIQLGRRFRALKLWFVLRSYGLSGIREIIANHIEFAKYFANEIIKENDFEILNKFEFNTVCFRFNPGKNYDLNEINEKLLFEINDSGLIYLTHTKLNGAFALRFVIGQTNVKIENVKNAIRLIKTMAREIIDSE